MYDLLVRNVDIVDGTGRERFGGDIGIRDGRVEAVGVCDGSAQRVLNADGLTATPGFIDIHTHYDAQILWDPLLMPSILHGVTTMIGGNCGFTVAPVGSNDVDYIASMLARVEGIPLSAIEAALDWQWRSFGDYLDRVEGTTAVNAGFLVGHSTIRRAILGEQSVQRPATPTEIDEMRNLLRRSLIAGGLGLSSSWTEAHSDASGDPVPSRSATGTELTALASTLREYPGTTLEFVPGLGTFSNAEFEIMTAMSLAADRPLNWNLIRIDGPDTTSAEHRLGASDYAAARGAAVMALVHPEPTFVQVNLATGYVFENLPGWHDVMYLPLAEKMAVLRDPASRAELRHHVEAASPLKWPLSVLADWESLTIAGAFSEANAGFIGRRIGELAAALRRPAFDVMLDIALNDDLQTHFRLERRGDDDETWRARVGIWRDPRTIVGGSDAGAHVDLMCGATYTTSLLAEAVRKRGLLSIEEAVRHLTSVPARLYGLNGRGTITPGCWADMLLIDADRVGPGPVHTRKDLPGGALRLFAEASGIESVIVNGDEVLRSGVHTGALPGRLIRSGTDTTTVLASSPDTVRLGA